MRSDKRLYLTTDRSRVVEEGDPDAGFLMVNEGGDVPTEHLDVYRAYRKEHEAKAEAEAKPEDALEPEVKAVEKPPENKARMMGERK